MRKLTADEIECRVAQVGKTGCSLLLYKTARVDRAILDEEFGPLGWQNDFKEIDGKMYGGIGIYSNDLCEWLWRWDCGTESNTEKEKGQASDCFKRAGFKWGIGVELYSAPFIFVPIETVSDNGKFKLKDKYIKFKVKNIAYDKNGDISILSIYDGYGNEVFKFPKRNDDIDIIEALKASDNIANLNKFYKKYESRVIDIAKFQAAYTETATKLKQKEVLNGNQN